MRSGARSFERACYCAAAWGCGLVPAPGDSPHPPTSHLAAKWRQLARDWWAAWVATFPPYQREVGRRGVKQCRGNEIVHPSPRKALTQYRGSWAKAHTPLESLSRTRSLGEPGWTFPATPPARPSLRAGAPLRPDRYPLVDPAGLLMLAVPGRSGWWALPESRPATPASPPGAAALQPPSSLGGSGAGQVGVGCALRCSLGAQNSFHSGNLSILKFLPVSCKTAAAGNVAWYEHTHVRTNG